MNCPHTETTAILAAFGEAPVEFEAHLAECAACRAAVREHTSTLAALEPLKHTVTNQPDRWSAPAVAFLLAAAILLAVQFGSSTEPVFTTMLETAPSFQAATIDGFLFDDGLDDDLASLEVELALYHLEES